MGATYTKESALFVGEMMRKTGFTLARVLPLARGIGLEVSYMDCVQFIDPVDGKVRKHTIPCDTSHPKSPTSGDRFVNGANHEPRFDRMMRTRL